MRDVLLVVLSVGIPLLILCWLGGLFKSNAKGGCMKSKRKRDTKVISELTDKARASLKEVLKGTIRVWDESYVAECELGVDIDTRGVGVDSYLVGVVDAAEIDDLSDEQLIDIFELNKE